MDASNPGRQALLPKPKDGIKKKFVISAMIVSNFIAWSCLSLMAPFFPIEAKQKGLGETVIGLIYSSSELVIFLMSPLMGRLISTVSPRFFYITGILVIGVTGILFGVLDKSPPYVPFIATCFAVRMIQATGVASLISASFMIAGQNYPDNIGTIYGILETAVGLGFMAGPAMGGGLYQLGGYGLPFWVLGGCTFACGLASWILLPTKQRKQECSATDDKVQSVWTIFTSPWVWFGSCTNICAYGSALIWMPVLSLRLSEFHLSQVAIGLLYTIPPGMYAITTPFWGYLIDRKIPPIVLILVGLILLSIMCLVFGPAPFLPFVHNDMVTCIVTLVLMGLCMGPVIISSIKCMVEGARDLGFVANGANYGVVGGVVQSSVCLGTLISPLLGGSLTERFGFAWMMVAGAIIALIPIVFFSPFLVYVAYDKCKSKADKKNYDTLNGEVIANNDIVMTTLK
ncbi:MFS-type transporter SLC18B1-like [Haliotis rubra]|uniref:MFS-type transporter SLC18B1-like n=1 Tax=Haliotis rubra TaxID=36100 RepID=UPI001EE5D3F9|nr:MFS-type transporter SLC18B1-like [Haliotis rubra]XP_046584260.1 MFS-type transporter SLC18B1-like [Haliotis rubra]